MKALIKAILILIISCASFSCSKDDGIPIETDPGQEHQQEESIPKANITNVQPQNGPMETTVVISGDNFGKDPSKVKVYFNEKEAIVLEVTNSKIRTQTPRRAGTGLIKVMIDGYELVGPEFEYQLTVEVGTFAGSGEGNVDGYGAESKFYNPTDLAMDQHGNIYVADSYNHVIRRITPDGQVSTFAGSKKGDAVGTLTTAKFNLPYGIAVDSKDNVYVADSGNNKIKKITPYGVVVTLAGHAQKGYKDDLGDLARFYYPYDVDVDINGNVFVADYYNNKIRKISPEGQVSTVAGGEEGFSDGPALEAQFKYPTGVAVDLESNVIVADNSNHRIRKISRDGIVSTVAGSNKGDLDGQGTNAQFHYPNRIVLDLDGNIYVADTYNHKIRKIDTHGEVSTLAGSTKGILDGSGVEAQFYKPDGLILGKDDIFYTAEIGNHRIRKIIQK